MMSGRDILFTTIHVITDWPVGTSDRGPIQLSVFRCVRRAQQAPIAVPRTPRQVALQGRVAVY
ncbi:unnamed protein product, partial [Staurois parvus]